MFFMIEKQGLFLLVNLQTNSLYPPLARGCQNKKKQKLARGSNLVPPISRVPTRHIIVGIRIRRIRAFSKLSLVCITHPVSPENL